MQHTNDADESKENFHARFEEHFGVVEQHSMLAQVGCSTLIFLQLILVKILILDMLRIFCCYSRIFLVRILGHDGGVYGVAGCPPSN